MGMPVVQKETVGRQSRTAGQPAHPREVKLGCVFTHTTWTKQVFPLRDPDSTTLRWHHRTAEEEFGKRIYLESVVTRSRRVQGTAIAGAVAGAAVIASLSADVTSILRGWKVRT